MGNTGGCVLVLPDVAGNIPSIPNVPDHRRLLTSNKAIGICPSNASLIVAQMAARRTEEFRMRSSRHLRILSSDLSQFVIYIKSGKYVETVLVPKNANNVVFFGDGVGKTIISGTLSVIGSNVTTPATATLTVHGKNFVGRNFTVENTAGPANHQAVAVRLTGAYPAFEVCQFLDSEHTMHYTHTNRQFDLIAQL